MELEIVYIDEEKVACEGEGNDIGHPKVFLDLSEHGEHTCPYCGRIFKLKK